MAKIRAVKPETWTDEKFVSVSPLARLLFIGIWNHACDNGHVDDLPIQLKMRVLPADNCDTAALIDELVDARLLERGNGYLKVTNLPAHQRIDPRYLSLCDHCEHDGHTAFSESDRTNRTQSAQRAHVVRPASAQRTHAVDGDGDGDGDTSSEKPDDPKIEELCNDLSTRMVANGCKKPTITKAWRTAARLILTKDGRSFTEAKSVLAWSQSDSFWMTNIQSMPKFRDQYDQLRLKSSQGNVTAINGKPTNPYRDW